MASVPGGGFVVDLLQDIGSVLGGLATGHIGFAVGQLGDAVGDLLGGLGGVNDPTFGFGGLLGSVPGGGAGGFPTFFATQTFTTLPGGGSEATITLGAIFPNDPNTFLSLLKL